MAKTYPIQHSFAAGEISPQLIARTDMDGYSESARQMHNMIPSIQGPAKSRPGFQFVAQAESAAEQYCRLIPFHVSFTESYAIIITLFWIYIADAAGFSPANNLITNSRFSDGADDWTAVEPGGATVVFAGGVCQLNSVVQLAAIQQQLTTDVGQIGAEHVIGYRGLNNSPVHIKVGTAQGLADILDTTLAGIDATVMFIPGVVNFWIEFEAPENTSKRLDTVICFDATDAEVVTRFPSPYETAEHVEQIQFEMVPGQKLMYLFQRDTAPQYIDYLGPHVWDSGEIIFDGGLPPWQIEEDIYPGAITFFKGRMYVGGTYPDEVGIWASEPGEYLNFILPTDDPEDGDPMYLPLDTEGDIMWLLGTKALFVGMDTGEHIIFGEGNAVPTPANVDTEQQSSYGSARVQAFRIGEQVAFVTTDRRKLYLASYNRDSLGWIGADVSFPSEHITEGLLREIELSSTPNQILWFPTFTGELVGMTFDPRRDIIGWHRHTTDGFIVSTTVIKNRGVSELWIGVLRGPIDGPQLLQFERAAPQQVDSYKVVTEVVATTVFAGYDHLEGRAVQILTDGAVHRPLVVGANGNPGEIEIDYTAFELVAGLGFLATLETLPIDMLAQSQSIGSYAKSWIKIFVKVLNSARPLINGVRPPIRNEATPMNDREPDRSEDIEVANLGWDLDASILIQQEQPLVLEVAGIFGELDLQNTADD